MKSNDEENILESEEESLPYHCKECVCVISSAIAEDNQGYCNDCVEKNRKMKSCKHKNLEYLGVQETEDNNKFVFLWNCEKCHSTISLNKKQMLKAIRRKTKKNLKTINYY